MKWNPEKELYVHLPLKHIDIPIGGFSCSFTVEDKGDYYIGRDILFHTARRLNDNQRDILLEYIRDPEVLQAFEDAFSGEKVMPLIPRENNRGVMKYRMAPDAYWLYQIYNGFTVADCVNAHGNTTLGSTNEVLGVVLNYRKV